MVLIVALLFTSTPLNAIAEELQNTGSESQPTQRIPQIVGEVIDKREENVKHFLRDDYTYEAAIYPVPVHFKENGKWQDIDNTLTKMSGAEGTYYTNKKNSYTVKLAETANAAKLVRIAKDGYELAWGLERSNGAMGKATASAMPAGLSAGEQKKTLTKLTSGVEYKNITPGVDLRYLVEPEEIKEYIILNQKVANPSFGFTIYVKGLKHRRQARQHHLPR